MMQGPITRTVRHRIDARSDARLPTAWVGGGTRPSAAVDTTWLTSGAIRLPRAVDGPVLVLLGADGTDARLELHANASAGARVYALVGLGWGTNEAEVQMVRAPRVLIRRVPEVPASGVLAGTVARLWLGGGCVLRLDGAQAEALRQTFLRLFWYEATEEAWSGGRQFVWRPARERPFDIPDVTAAALVRWEGPDARLEGESGASMHVAKGPPPKVAPRRLWFPAGPEHHDHLSKLAKAGSEILWADRGLPDLLVAGGSGEVLLKGTRGRLRLHLTPDQAREIGRLLEADSVWRFHTDLRLGDPSHRKAMFWLPGDVGPHGLEAEQVVEVAEVAASSLRAVPESAPASVPAPQPLSLSVRYQWTVVPPRLPGGTDEDALVGRWRKLDEDWTSRIAGVREALVAAEADRGRIGRAFTRLVSAMLGFERTHGGLLARVAELEAQRPSKAGPTDAPALLNRLAEVEEHARRHQADLDDAERKAREDEERERQQAAWKARVEEAKTDLPDRRSALSAAEARHASITEDLRTTDDALKQADEDAKKDLSVRRRKLSDDIHRAGKDITRLRGEIAALEKQAAAPFVFRQPATPGGRPARSGGRFVPPAPSARPASPVPDDAMPEVGTLRSRKGQRYLVIQTWDELAAGEQAASRLSAKLVAPETA